MPAKIATAEDVQAELRTLLAMTEGEAPSRARISTALTDLAHRIAGVSDYDVKDLKKTINILTDMRKDLNKVYDKEGGVPNALINHSLLVTKSPSAAKLEKLLQEWHVHRGMAEVKLRELTEELEGLLESIPS